MQHCDHFPACGGCKIRNLGYETQMQEKMAELQALFPDTPIEGPYIGPPSGYRSKMEFTFSQDRAGRRFLGLHQAKGRGRVEDIIRCHLMPAFCSEIQARVKSWWEASSLPAFFPPKNEGTLRTLTVRTGEASQDILVILTISGRLEFAPEPHHIEAFSHLFDDMGKVGVFLIIQKCEKGTPTLFLEKHLSGIDRISERLLEHVVTYSPQSFFQPNPIVYRHMLLKAREWLSPGPSDTILDLFCGIGTFAISLAPYAGQVYGVELSSTSVADAKENLTHLGIENMDVYCVDVKDFFASYGDFVRPNFALVDPPRAGLGEAALRFFEERRFEKILYVSCNPHTQVSDIQKLKSYRVEKAALFDQFPHTVHMESMVLLTFAC